VIILSDRHLTNVFTLASPIAITRNVRGTQSPIVSQTLITDIIRNASKQVSTRDILKSWLCKLPPGRASVLFSNLEYFALEPLAQLFTDHMIGFIEVAYLQRYLTVGFHLESDLGLDLDDPLSSARLLHEHGDDAVRCIERFAMVLEARSPEEHKHLAADVDYLLNTMKRLVSRLENGVNFLAQGVSIKENRISMAQTTLVTKVSKLAFLFVPVSTVAAILSISGPDSRFIILGVVCGPFVVFLSLAMFLFTPERTKNWTGCRAWIAKIASVVVP
jgi:hypothetical protein